MAQQLSTTPDTDSDSVRTVTRWETVLPPSAVPCVPSGASAGMSTTFQPTTAYLESRAFTAHLTGVPGSLGHLEVHLGHGGIRCAVTHVLEA